MRKCRWWWFAGLVVAAPLVGCKRMSTPSFALLEAKVAILKTTVRIDLPKRFSGPIRIAEVAGASQPRTVGRVKTVPLPPTGIYVVGSLEKLMDLAEIQVFDDSGKRLVLDTDQRPGVAQVLNVGRVTRNGSSELVMIVGTTKDKEAYLRGLGIL